MNYKNGKIYKIIGGAEFYIGATTKERLCQRMASHRRDYQNWKNGKGSFVTSFYIFEKYGMVNCTIELVELCPCQSKDELSAREGYHIRNTTCVNKVIPNRTREEYRVDNRAHTSEYNRKYNDEHREQSKQYYVDNREQLLEYNRKYKAEHREAISKKITCDCGGQFTHQHKQDHIKTAKHQQFISLGSVVP